jgi:hypothetical protein
MSTAVLCDSPIEGLILRIIKLNACGVPVTGTGSAQIVMDGFIQVQDSPQYDTGDRKITRKANGTLCQNYKLPDQFTNDELTIDFCVFHPGVIVNALAGRLLTATLSPTGTGVAMGTWANAAAAHWSLEVWQAPPQACDSSGIVYYPYHAWPHISDGKRGDMSINNDPTMLQIIGNTYDASPLWTAGATYLGANQVVLGDHWLRNLQNTAPPPSACIIADYP